MPAGGGAGSAVALEVVLFLGSSNRGSFLRVEAHGDHIELVSDIELHHLHCAGKAGEDFSAEHGAVVVDQIQDQRLLAEVVAEFDGTAGVVDEGEIWRNLSVEMLFDANILQIRRTNVGWGRHDAFGHRLRHGLSRSYR